jgi:hypothetical protein
LDQLTANGGRIIGTSLAFEICSPIFLSARFSSIIRLRRIFDDEAGFEFADLLGEAGGLDALEDFFGNAT